MPKKEGNAWWNCKGTKMTQEVNSRWQGCGSCAEMETNCWWDGGESRMAWSSKGTSWDLKGSTLPKTWTHLFNTFQVVPLARNSAAGAKAFIIYILLKTGNTSCIPMWKLGTGRINQKISFLFCPPEGLFRMRPFLSFPSTTVLKRHIVIDDLIPARDILNIFPSEGHDNGKSKG